MSVDDHGLEAIRKSAHEVTPGSKAEYYLLVSILGTLLAQYSGLSKELKVTTMKVTDVATKIPATPLTDRNHIEIHNLSTTETLFILENNTVTADRVVGLTSGKEILPNSFYNLDIKDVIELWGIVAAGKEIFIKVTEVA
jgi:hypothetical protein